MKSGTTRPTLIAAALLTMGIGHAAGAQTPAQDWITPAIPGFGAVRPLPQARYRPSGHDQIKVVFDVHRAAPQADRINPALERVAATINAYVAGGTPLDQLKLVAVIAGAATPAALDDAHYRQRFGRPNPNLPLLAALTKAGVDIVVSGQSLARQRFADDWIAQPVALALSSATTLTLLEQQGYAALVL